MNTKHEITNKDLLYPELSYQIQGAVFQVANKYGKGLREQIYQKALAEEFIKAGVKFEEQRRINIYSLESSKVLGTYVPDFIIDDKVIVEIKATDFPIKKDTEQQLSYLKASRYEVGYVVNFGTPRLYMKRMIFTNDRKPFISLLQKNYAD